RQVRVSKSTINRVLTGQLIRPFHIQPVQELLPHDLAPRLQFSQIIQQYRTDDMDFHKKILFTDEACFTRCGVTNLHNQHVMQMKIPMPLEQNLFNANLNTLPDLFDESRWIGRGNDAPISWPPRSPDLNPCDFFIWGDLKQKVY
ncbi:hypothetical protein NQ318_001138, partial [Aromia moschata]